MDAHEAARLRAAPLVARLMRVVAADRECETDDLSPTLHADIENAVLLELADLIDPWAPDKRTPTRPADARTLSGVRKR